MLGTECLPLDSAVDPVPTGSVDDPTVVLATISSDAHSWNLVVLQLLLEEAGHTVCNLGPCTPPADLIAACLDYTPALIVLSSVNGHGLLELPEVVRTLRRQPRLGGGILVAGGKLTTSGGLSATEIGSLRADGVDRVFTDGDTLASFSRFLRGVPVGGGQAAR